jgi:hypothetical protein
MPVEADAQADGVELEEHEEAVLEPHDTVGIRHRIHLPPVVHGHHRDVRGGHLVGVTAGVGIGWGRESRLGRTGAGGGDIQCSTNGDGRARGGVWKGQARMEGRRGRRMKVGFAGRNHGVRRVRRRQNSAPCARLHCTLKSSRDLVFGFYRKPRSKNRNQTTRLFIFYFA